MTTISELGKKELKQSTMFVPYLEKLKMLVKVALDK
jgi:hypothetical protein